MPDGTTLLQTSLHDQLVAFVNGGTLTRADALLSLLPGRFPLQRHVLALSESFRRFNTCIPSVRHPGIDVEVPVYAGKQSAVLTMMDGLSAIEDDLAGAYVHGSLATDEGIAYSDFDALVILRDRLFAAPGRLISVAERLGNLRQVMLDHDPLQHHGWFVLTESDLHYYCDAWFPAELFRHAARLTRKAGGHLTLLPRDSRTENRKVLATVCNSVLRQTERQHLPGDLYALKSLFSEFMLLPALYLQVKTGQGVYKKQSFDLARPEFSPDLWVIMDTVSRLRNDWIQPVPAWWRKLAGRPSGLRRQLIRAMPLPVPAPISERLTPEHPIQMAGLAREMLRRSENEVLPD